MESKINEDRQNTTRFAVFSRSAAIPQKKSGQEHFILVFTVRNEAGMLAKAISIIGKYGFNMRSLRSRPMKGLMWQYYFYVEAEGSIQSAEGREMLEKLSSYCDKLKIAGNFFPQTLTI